MELTIVTLQYSSIGSKEICYSMIHRPYSQDYLIPDAVSLQNVEHYCLLSLSTESIAFLKSTNVRTAVRFLAFIPSANLLKVSIWATVDLPGRNLF